MTGQNCIIELRLNHYLPDQVWVMVCDAKHVFYASTHPEMCVANGMFPEVWIDPQENPWTLDFRFLTGVLVHVCGTDAARCKLVAERILSINPRRVLASGWGELLDLTHEEELL